MSVRSSLMAVTMGRPRPMCGRLLYARRLTSPVIGDTVDSDFTFEDLSAIVRREKSSGSLSEVRSDLYPAMMGLLDRQSRECERQIGIDIGSLASAAANERRKKIHQSVKLVVEHRMSKVAALAMRTAMGCVNSTEGLPSEEKVYYEAVLEASKVHWGNTERKKKKVVLMDLESVSQPSLEPVTEEVPTPEIKLEAGDAQTLKDMPVMPDDDMDMEVGDIEFPDDFSEFPESEDVPVTEGAGQDAPAIADPVEAATADDVESDVAEEIIISDVQAEPHVGDAESDVAEDVTGGEVAVDSGDDYDDNSILTIHVTEDIPDFVGPTRDYRLRKDDVIRMPVGMANVLINRKMAVKLV